MMMKDGWIGVDFDGTLALYDERRGIEVMGAACLPMVRRIHHWLEQGIEIRIMTARAGDPALSRFLQPWLREHNLPALAITQSKDPALLQCWDDRAVQVEHNTGAVLTPKAYVPLVPSGWIGVELDGTLSQAAAAQPASVIGEPVPLMLQRVRQWLMVGMDVRLFTGRAADPAQLPLIAQWQEQHGLSLPVTGQKDFQMSVFYDSRAVHVIHNTGEPSVEPEPLPALRLA